MGLKIHDRRELLRRGQPPAHPKPVRDLVPVGFALIEAPDTTTSAGIAIAINASGAFRKFETTVLMTQDELLNALKKAQDVAYVAPGAAVHA